MKRLILLIPALVSLLASAAVPERLDVAYSSIDDGCHINSMEHFRAAIDAGFNCLKADMNITSDGVVVLCHDRGFTFDGNGRIGKFDRNNNTVIRSLSWKQIRAMEYAAGKAEKGTYPKVATLEQLAQLCRKTGVWMYITLRAYDQRETLSEVVRILRKYKMTDRCIINNYPPDEKTCALIREYLPEVPISFTTTSKMDVDSALVDRVAAYAPIMICANRNHIPSPEVVSYAVGKGVRCLGWYPADAGVYAEWLSRGLSGAQICRKSVIANLPFKGGSHSCTAESRNARGL